MAPALVLAYFTARFTVKTALRQFHAEKWWERKADAYSRIVESLQAMMEYWSAKADEEITRQEIREDRAKKLSDSYDHAHHELSKATAVGAYIISEEVAGALAKLKERPHLSLEEEPWVEICMSEHDAHKKALTEIRRLAKIDLGV